MRPPSLSSRFSEPLLEVAHETDTDTESGRENSADNEDAPPLPPHLAYTMSQVKRVDSEVADNLLVFGRAYASTFSFWKYIILAGVLGLIMGFLALAFFWSFYAVLCNWIFTPQYDRSVVTTTFHPTVMWVVIPTCTGFALGLVKLLPLGRFSFPIKIHGFFRKISSLEVHPNEAPIVVFGSFLSLASGGTVGPEAALGWMGCATAQVVCGFIEDAGKAFAAAREQRRILATVRGAGADRAGGSAGASAGAGVLDGPSPPHLRSRGGAAWEYFAGFLCEPLRGMNQAVVALDAIGAGLGAMFPTPALAVLMMHELTLAANLNIFASDYMERITSSLLGATLSWLVFNRAGGKNLIPTFNQPAAGEGGGGGGGGGGHWKGIPVPGAAEMWNTNLCLSDNPSEDQHNKMTHYRTAAVLGFVSAGVGLVMLLSMGLFRKIGQRVQLRFRERNMGWVATLLLPTVAGLVCGLVGHALPLTFGDGSYQISLITENLFKGQGGVRVTPPSPLSSPMTMTTTTTTKTHGNDDDDGDDGDDGSFPVYTADYLMKSAAADCFVLAVCQGFGFIGGQIFPTLYVGFLSGCVAFLKYGVQFEIAIPCMMVAVPCAFVPTPFTFVFLIAIIYGLDGIRTTYVLIAVITSFGANCGLGFVQTILMNQVMRSAASGGGPEATKRFRTGLSGDADDPISSSNDNQRGGRGGRGGGGGGGEATTGRGSSLSMGSVGSRGGGGGGSGNNSKHRTDRSSSDTATTGPFSLRPSAMSELLANAFFFDCDDDEELLRSIGGAPTQAASSFFGGGGGNGGLQRRKGSLLGGIGERAASRGNYTYQNNNPSHSQQNQHQHHSQQYQHQQYALPSRRSEGHGYAGTGFGGGAEEEEEEEEEQQLRRAVSTGYQGLPSPDRKGMMGMVEQKQQRGAQADTKVSTSSGGSRFKHASAARSSSSDGGDGVRSTTTGSSSRFRQGMMPTPDDRMFQSQENDTTDSNALHDSWGPSVRNHHHRQPRSTAAAARSRRGQQLGDSAAGGRAPASGGFVRMDDEGGERGGGLDREQRGSETSTASSMSALIPTGL